MRRAFSRGLILGATVFTVGLFSRAEPVAESYAREPTLEPEYRPLGMSSCASAACHGRPNAPSLTAAPAEGCWQSSLTHYLAVDPHQKAYDVLKNERSAKITAGLRKKSSVPIPDAWNDARCLACHTNPTLAPETVPESWKALRSEGVSCEACHGNAAEWKGPHTAWDKFSRNWKGPIVALKVEDLKPSALSTGFVDLNVPRVRAETCVGCHHGAPAGLRIPVRDMNHDMIAAGHPELKFEYEKLLSKLPKHWYDKDRHSGTISMDLRETKSIGEKASKDLKMDRESRHTARDPRTPFPELSDQWACVKCHNELRPK